VFISDTTFVGKSITDRPIPNPNVLIEYGFALKSIGYRRIIQVMNTFYGKPTEENMPFDMKYVRYPITYHLPSDASMEERREVREALEKDLTNALKLVIDAGLLKKQESAFIEIQSTTNPSTFLQPDERFVIEGRWGPQDQLKLPETQRLFLRLIPTRTVPAISSTKTALDMIRDGGLEPLTYGGGAISTGRNKYGAFVCSDDKYVVNELTQLFNNRELWGIEAWLISRDNITSIFGTRFAFFPAEFEATFTKSLRNYLTFASNTLKLPLPLKFIAGATDVEGYRMSPLPGRRFIGREPYKGRCVKEHILYEGNIESYDVDVAKTMRPFFQKVWEECGLERSDID